MNSLQRIILGVGLLVVAFAMHRLCFGVYLFTPMSQNLVGPFKPWPGYSTEFAVVVGMVIPMLCAVLGAAVFAGLRGPDR